MAFEDWSDAEYDHFHDVAFEDVFNKLDLSGLDDDQIAAAEELFEAGWTDFGISKEEAEAMREEFYDLTAYGPEDIDWEAYREAYDEAGG